MPNIAVDVATRLDRQLPLLTVDTYRLVQALTYLCSYAVAATTSGKKKVKLTLSARVRGSAPSVPPPAGSGQVWRQLEIVVAAPDAEVPPDERRRIFDGFRGVKGRTGLGLGPHLARRFVELHGGSVVLTPGPGGLSFEVVLPA
jgi:signal transduction histidine kinase